MRQISDETLAELLFKRLRNARSFQIFARRLGPGDVVYISALAWDADGRIVELKASADDPERALTQLFRKLDQATEPRNHDQHRDEYRNQRHREPRRRRRHR